MADFLGGLVRGIKSIRSGISANILAQAVGIAVQLTTVPLFLYFWNVERYGAWLILTALPAYVALADLGIGAALSNAMLIAVSRDDRGLAQRHFAMAQAAILSTGLVVGLVGMVALSTFSIPYFSSLPNPHITIPCLFAYGVLSLYSNTIYAPFRAADRYSTGVNLGTVFKAVEFLAVAVCLVLKQNETTLVVVMLVSRIVAVAVTLGMLQRSIDWLSIRPSFSSIAEFRSVFQAGLGLMSFPVINALTNQGFITAIGTGGDMRAVATYSTLVSLSRIVGQTVNSITGAFQPEVIRALTAQALAEAKLLFRLSVSMSFWIAFGLGLGLVLLGPWFLSVWTAGQVRNIFPELLVVSIAQVVRSIWLPGAQLLTGLNKPGKLASFQMAVALLSVDGVVIGARLGHGMDSAVGITLAAEIITLVFVLRVAVPLLDETPRSYLAATANIGVVRTLWSHAK